MSIGAVSSLQGNVEKRGFSFPSTLLRVAKIILQMAVRIFFVLASLVFAAVLLPVDWYSIGLPIATLVSAFVSSTFFQGATLSKPLESREIEPPKPPLPKDAPRGLKNEASNCAFNSLFHFFKSSPEIADWISAPLTEDLAAQQAQEDSSSAAGISLQQIKDGQAPAPIQTRYKNILALRSAYQQFDRDYQQAVDKDASCVAESQSLRLALNKINAALSPNPKIQEDAAECFTTFFDLLPEKDKLRSQISRHYVTGEVRKEQETTSPQIALALKQKESEPLHLQKMFNNELDDDELGILTVGGQEHQYNRTTVELTSVPKALYLQVKRFTCDKASRQAQKNDQPVIVPQELTVQVKGAPRTYQLTSFIHHSGFTPYSGHYSAGRVIGGNRYLISDRNVTLAADREWEERLRTSYLLCYIPKP